ncbi:hypothetical protein HQ346_09515 [Rhodococcus sp. BP-252]|uniref:Transmembrane protein n=1 Tax=Rhodococcoides kyotonense TaxID=398843 RepID=A0A177Y8S7_9NOCA|nr:MULTISPECIES: hypothetical protein [Rhodococcus]MBY6411916.1 hypothetical protein [Rhodococcus sp. BP-320]MBY6416456.1 hypothetical protein [Rhodococcus sp. BP-321]MBY6420738.1 hypothetical protein [Rhodococcus sp. BP-324]MBY6426480.1 hypothetical protein [Rhodococcus sp. BP-323]MBY6431479.1 hypothetical protein [Rhodococcus sp. BP-322]
MTSTSKVRDVAVGTGGNLLHAARIASTGPAGIGAAVATRGYSLARTELARRKKAKKQKARSTAGVSRRTRRLVVFGTLFGAAAGAAFLATKRRRTVQPPADAPPSLSDYADDTPRIVETPQV